MYRIIGADGREYGPVSAELIRQWIAEGRCTAQTRVCVEGSTEWKSLAEFPELAAALSSAAQIPLTPPGEPLPPGATPLPPDVTQRDYDMDPGGCLSRAWQLLTGPKMWPIIGVIAIWFLIQIGLAGLAQIPFIGVLFAAASWVLGGQLYGGAYYFMLRCIRGQPAEVGDLFAGFRHRFVHLFLGYVVRGLLSLASALPGLILFMIGLIPTVKPGGEATLTGVGLMVVGGVVALVPAVYLAICWCFTLPLILDKGLNFWPAMKLGRTVVKKHWWTTLLLWLLCGAINVVGLLACCIGFFFAFPLSLATMMYAYERLFTLSTELVAPGGPRVPTQT
jgi:hypothetical protein